MMDWNAGMGWMGGFGWFWPMVMMLFWVAVIGLGVWLAGTALSRSTTPQAPGDSALDILKRRYARGEIARDEYEEGRRLLGS